MSRAGQRSDGLYVPLDWVMVRAPLLPIERYLALPEGTDWPVADPWVRRALAVGAADLTRALERPPAEQRARARLSGKVLRYVTRMSSRPTPFGLFAGVGLARWGEGTDIRISSAPPRVRTRPDMGWLLGFVSTMERRADVRAALRWFANPAAFIRAGRVFLTEPTPLGERTDTVRAISLRATPVVRRVLELARTPLEYRDLVAELTGSFGAPRDKVAGLLEQLWEQTVLLSDLRPPLTIAEPARYVAERLSAIPPAEVDAAALADLLDAVAAGDGLTAAEAATGYPKLVVRARELYPEMSSRGPYQTDLALSLAGGRIHRAVAAEAARAAELLIRLSPWRDGMPVLSGYKRAFIERYESDRDVPLLELVDPELGLGPPAPAERMSQDGRRAYHRALTDLALDAIRNRLLVVELDEQTIATLGPGPTRDVPASLDMSVFVVAGSPQAIDAGDFRIVVGPNLGSLAAGRVLGRFAGLIGPDADAALLAAAEAEAARRPGRIFAEVSYLPRPGRLANLTIRPLVRGHELAVDTLPGATPDRAIPLAELMITIRDDRFVLHWPATGQEVVPCAGHMLTAQAAPAVVRFLDELTRDGRSLPTLFDWGPASEFPFLPRIQAGRIVLAPARWQLEARHLTDLPPDEFAVAIAGWRQRWDVPRYIHVGSNDHRLLLDLDAATQVEQLRAEVRAARVEDRVTVHEALPSPDQTWLPGPDGRHVGELVVPVVRNGGPEPPRPVAARPATVATDRRLRPPGSDWLFAKLYHLPTFEEDLLAGDVRTFCAEAVAAGLADRWFFIRYVDPAPHLRIRWHGDPRLLTDRLTPRLLRWGSALMAKGFIRRLGLDTYDREVKRYGGPNAIALAEELFAADSSAVVELLHLVDDVLDLDRTLLAVYTVDDLLGALRLSEAEQDEFRRTAVVDRRASAEQYRRQQTVLRSMLGDPHWLAAQPGGPAANGILARRRARIRDIADRLETLDDLSRTGLDLARSFVHMHCNRLLGAGHGPEQQVLGLLLRASESLRRAKDFPGHREGSRPS